MAEVAKNQDFITVPGFDGGRRVAGNHTAGSDHPRV